MDFRTMAGRQKSRAERGLPAQVPAKRKQSAAMKRGTNGQGMLVPGMYDNVAHKGDVMQCCGCELVNDGVVRRNQVPEQVGDECECYCHETARMVQRYKK
jgi:hypothetical protein